MQTLPYMLAAMCVGIIIAAQPPMNALVARAIGSAASAAVISIAIALVFSMVLVAFSGAGRIAGDTLAQLPWWVWLAGVAGTVFVAGGIVIAPVTGALVFFVCLVAGQMIGSSIADHFGLFGLEVHPVSALRLCGIALVIPGAICVMRG